MQDPETTEEWQDAVDAAHFMLALDSARKYGLVSGGPQVNVERASEVLRRGAGKGIAPSTDCIERGVRELLSNRS